MFQTVVSFIALLVPSLVAGSLAGGLTARWLLHRRGALKPRPAPLPHGPGRPGFLFRLA